MIKTKYLKALSESLRNMQYFDDAEFMEENDLTPVEYQLILEEVGILLGQYAKLKKEDRKNVLDNILSSRMKAYKKAVLVVQAQDDDGHWYMIPKDIMPVFNTDLKVIQGKDYMEAPDNFDLFNEKYEKYRTLGAPDLPPDYYKENDFFPYWETGAVS